VSPDPRQTFQKFKRLILRDISIVQDEYEFIAELLHERLDTPSTSSSWMAKTCSASR
jgi:hypothetical protein